MELSNASLLLIEAIAAAEVHDNCRCVSALFTSTQTVQFPDTDQTLSSKLQRRPREEHCTHCSAFARIWKIQLQDCILEPLSRHMHTGRYQRQQGELFGVLYELCTRLPACMQNDVLSSSVPDVFKFCVQSFFSQHKSSGPQHACGFDWMWRSHRPFERLLGIKQKHLVKTSEVLEFHSPD
jgi:hypothetical protein